MTESSDGNTDLIVQVLTTLDDAAIRQLSDVLIDCVEGGASVSFMLPLSRERAESYWRNIAIDVADKKRVIIVAQDANGICGTVQLVLDQPENQPHRADLSKMLVHRLMRRNGVGRLLMSMAEDVARQCGKTLLVLDTASDDAERLYQRQGWTKVGVVPDFALLPNGGYCDTTFYYRKLDQQRIAQ